MDPVLMENKLRREIAARTQAEKLLEEKSGELYYTNKALEASSREFLEQANELQAILEHTSAAIIMINSEGKIYRSNQMAHDLFGESNTRKNQQFREIFADSSQSKIDEILLNPDQFNEALELEASKGTNLLCPIEVSISSIQIDQENLTIWICRDITYRREQENELRQAQKMEALGSLASGIAHEINTPVQFVSDNIRFLQDSFEDLLIVIEKYKLAVEVLETTNKDEIVEGLVKAEEACDLEFLKEDLPDSIEQSLNGMKRIGQIVGAIKEFSHPGQSETSSVDINHAIETTVLVAKNQWKYVAEVEKDLAENLPMFEGTAGDVNQVLLNLIVNAAHAIEDKGEQAVGKIKVTTRHVDETLVLEVQDNGCGIPKENLERIFDPFFTTKEVGKGTGQGLAITFNMIKKLGGTVSVESEVGSGTCFRLVIPLQHVPSESI